MRINLFCRMNQSGVGRHAKYSYDNLLRLANPHIDIRHVDLDDKTAVAKAIVEGQASDVAIFFLTQDPRFLQMIKGKQILWCAFESSRIPKRLCELMSAFDEVWAPSQWGQNVMIQSGLDPQKIKTVPEGVDTQIYFPQPRKHPGFVFLSVAKYEKRKGIDELLRAFTEEFPAVPDVALWLKADFPLFPERMETLKKSISNDSRIKLFEGYASDAEIAALYNCADAFVFPSRAEGFGLPCLEAISCGVPVLATNYSGQTEYLNAIDTLYLPLDYSLEDIVDTDFDHFFKDLYAGEPYGQWAAPDVGALRKGMRHLYAAHEEAKQKAAAAACIIRDKFDWKVSAEKALAALGVH